MGLLRLLSSSAKRRIVVFGGNGFVGQNIIKTALRAGINVTSINRSGEPPNFSWEGGNSAEVQWCIGDIMNGGSWIRELNEACGAISCVGAFGSDEVFVKL